MLKYRQLYNALAELGLERTRPVIAHASLSAFGQVHGGAETLLGAILSLVDSLIMPTFTYRTMVIPEVGPGDNAITYGSGREANRVAEFWQPDLPADPLMGIVPEALRRYPKAQRSTHPILSFAGVNADAALQAQTLAEPLAPVRILHEAGGWALLLGINHTANTSIHYAERLAGRKQFVRWALTPDGIVECPGWPGCSNGFQAIAPRLQAMTRQVAVGEAVVTAVPLAALVEAVRAAIAEDPLALLCDDPQCERCQAVRAAVVQAAL